MRPIYFAEYRGEGHIFTRPDPFKAEILAYFEGIEPAAVAAGYFTDEITGEQVTDRTEFGYIDGGWTWTAGDVYHFERYDLELSQEFREHATGRLIIDDTAGEATRSPIRGSEISLREFLDGFPKDEHGNALMLDYIPDNDQERRNIDPTVKAITDQFRWREHATGRLIIDDTAGQANSPEALFDEVVALMPKGPHGGPAIVDRPRVSVPAEKGSPDLVAIIAEHEKAKPERREE